MEYFIFALFTACQILANQEPVPQKTNSSKYINLSAYDSEESLPSIGSSLLDKLYSQKNSQGVVEYNIPYPYDQFIDRMAGRSIPKKRILTRLKDIKTTNEFTTYLVNDMFYLQSIEEQDLEVLMPFGRSLQKPRSNLNIKNPWLSPRELITPNNNYEPYLNEVGMIKNRIFCGHAEDLKSMECISWNTEAGRFEFQIIEDYERDKTPKVFYVQRSKCLSCHQSAAPIFPTLSWLETDDSITLEMGIAVSHFNQSNPKTTSAENDAIVAALNTRAVMLSQSRKNNFSSTTARFRSIKAGKFDGAVDASNRLIRLNKLWVHLCGNTIKGNKCRRDLFKGYFLAALTEKDKAQQTLATFFLNKGYTSENIKTEELNNSFIFFPFFYDRDPLTSVLTMSEIMTCARGTCTSEILKKINSDPYVQKIVSSGESLTSFFNPRLLRKSPLFSESKKIEQVLADTAINLNLIFVSGTKFKNGPQEQKSDIREIAEGLGHKEVKATNPDANEPNKVVTNTVINSIFSTIDKMNISTFNPSPLNREKILADLWKQINVDKAAVFSKILNQETPTKQLLKEDFSPLDFSATPVVKLMYNACSECHSSKSDRFGVPQFLHAESETGVLAKIFYRKDSIIKQLSSKNMPPSYGMYNVTENEREQIINFLNNMNLKDIGNE